MSWSGFPFPYYGGSFFDSGVFSLSKIPTIIVDSGFGYDTLIASIIGALVGTAVPGYIAWKTIRANNEALTQSSQNQAKAAKEQLTAQYISANRQLWINDLRETVARFISIANNIFNLQVLVTNEYKKGALKDEVVYKEMYKEISHDKSELTFHKSKIRLLLNPDEQESKDLIDKLNAITAITNSHKAAVQHIRDPFDVLITQCIDCAQIICKNEWKIVKKLN
ncbi:hypothetical protein BZ160_04645 [Pantoea vagans]|nr:hypothetical protein [Pantoea vagans]OQV43413.1 hypothetical protein BZ160_04645 [Pantoea vagans]